MSQSVSNPASFGPAAAPVISQSVPASEASSTHIDQLLSGLSEAATGQADPIAIAKAPPGENPASDRGFENQLAMVRLGMATSLFYALRTKHAPTAAHSLRVALSCSAWCERLGMCDADRDRIEVAALLHDVGKIGIPDRVLRKPARLTVEEQLTMACCPQLGCEILRGCTGDQKLLAIVRHCGDWYDSRRQSDTIRGDALPLGSRMLSIVGAFDAMTTDQVYRAAMSREQALSELFAGSGTQFDPTLARDFAMMLEKSPEMLHRPIVHRWLQQLSSHADYHWNANPSGHTSIEKQKANRPRHQDTVSASQQISVLTADSNHLIDRFRHFETLATNLRDGVAFVDREGQILYWNESLAQLTRIPADAIVGQQWDCESVRLLSDRSVPVERCPVEECAQRQATVTLSMKCLPRHFENQDAGHEPLDPMQADPSHQRDVFVQAVPVAETVGGGAVVIVRDMSDRAEMQNQIQSLHKKATSDPLTGVANRAEFDKRLLHCTTKAAQSGETFSLIICDIDHFKQVNDVHGHQAGDEALVEFAKILQQHSRGTDLVARYGGEEFVYLAINSDNATATHRAEEIRAAVERTPLEGLGGDSVTVSIGVTQYQTGDAPETVVARADRALLQAKENGRNRVIQLGSGRIDTHETDESGGWFSWLGRSSNEVRQEFDLVTPVPTDLAVEKLRGFIADHQAEIVNVTGSELSLRLIARGGSGRRASDFQMTLEVHISLSESRGNRNQRGNSVTLTKLHLNVSPVRSRDRRSDALQSCIGQVVSSLRSYLMAELVD